MLFEKLASRPCSSVLVESPSADDLIDAGFAPEPAMAMFDPHAPSHQVFHWRAGQRVPTVDDLGGVPLPLAGLGRLLPDAVAVSAVSAGRLRRVEGTALQPGAVVRVAQQVERDEPACVLTAILSDGRMVVVAHAEGRQADVLLRMLALPTPGPDAPPIWFWLVTWLIDAIIGGAAADFRHVASWHPAVESEELACTAGDELVDFVVQRHRDHAATVGWSGLHQAALAGRLELGSVDATLARWLDIGSFARLVDERLGSPAELARLVSRSFPAPVVATISEIVVRLAPSRDDGALGPSAAAGQPTSEWS